MKGGYKKQLFIDEGLDPLIFGDTLSSEFEKYRLRILKQVEPFKNLKYNERKKTMILGNKKKVNEIKANEAKKGGLNLGNGSKGIIDKKSEITLGKIVEIEELRKMVKSQSVLIEGLKGDIAEQQKDIIRFSSAIKSLKDIIEENNKLIVNLSLKVKTKELKTLPVNETKTINKKGEGETKTSGTYPIDLETISLNDFYELFLKESGISFYGSKNTTYPETFESFITHIDNESIETMNDSLRTYWGKYKTDNKNSEKKYLFSPAGIPLAVKAMGKLLFNIEITDFEDKKPVYEMEGETKTETSEEKKGGLDLGKNYRVKMDKSYFVTVFKTDMSTLNEVFNHAKNGVELSADDKKDIREFIVDNSEYEMNEINKKAWTELFGYYDEVLNG